MQLLETNFVEKHQGHGFDGVVATIYVVPQEQIVGPREPKKFTTDAVIYKHKLSKVLISCVCFYVFNMFF